jgi:catechol 2,3-dioxygenase-like lactoylglutathione lyase family enzyme
VTSFGGICIAAYIPSAIFELKQDVSVPYKEVKMAKTQTQREGQTPIFKDVPAFPSFAAKDLRAEKAFLTDTLGLDVDDQNGMLLLNLAGSNKILIYPKPDHTPASFTVLNFPVDDINEAVKELTSRGIKFERYNLPGLTPDENLIYRGEGPPIAWFKDPSGNILSVLEGTGPQ